jgi:hypothetical protein
LLGKLPCRKGRTARHQILAVRLGALFGILWLSFLLIWPVADEQAAQALPGTYSSDAVEIWWGRVPRSKPLEIKSPDGMNSFIAEYHRDTAEIDVYLTIKGRRFKTDIGELVNCEVLWSPDSQALGVTYSDGGSVGTYHARIYRVEQGGFQVEDPSAEVDEVFLSQKLVCFRPEAPNVGVICWLGGSTRILLAAEIPPHSNCDNSGTFKAYEVSLPSGEVVRTYGQIEAKRLFGRHLGTELRHANDGCLLRPKSCQIPALHRGAGAAVDE